MRSIVFFDHDPQDFCFSFSDYELLSGEKAYSFLLEVICGLHSKLMGETEILGQFKDFSRSHKGHFSQQLKEVMQSLLKDAKKIRTEYLQNLGCQSYGSLLRKNLKSDDQRVVFIGAGLLVNDILPWLAKGPQKLDIYTRTPEKHKDLELIAPSVSVSGFEDIRINDQDVLVIAAPVSREWLVEKLDLNQFSMIYDLRGQSNERPLLQEGQSYLCLNDFIGDIEKNQIEARRVKNESNKAIAELTSLKRLGPVASLPGRRSS
ncbi:MAG: hypothetical protein HRT44_12725 [Bdellovibrionales bacterium]|nr:hypothetical protein [Bdellovibrionales bacterium]NQZ20101.1 hypothetical protein [Bdellovibrionales bacterium]